MLPMEHDTIILHVQYNLLCAHACICILCNQTYLVTSGRSQMHACDLPPLQVFVCSVASCQSFLRIG